ncbi:class E sortase [Streptomyces sp. NRRL F-2664]|uniref:class E sortase n=1 Tax=Streptomyces sp. NRRL F-2664 TaxID=1463842 RepID=UPI000995E64B|nr:class E sortase [Streptomyces sp. NRRL F-2664]
MPYQNDSQRADGTAAPFRSLGCAGEIFLTVALLLGAYLAYTLWWTNIKASQASKSTSQTIRMEWQKEAAEGQQAYDTSSGIGFLHIPSLKVKGDIPIVPGTDPERLNEGVAGYYTEPFKAAMPWEEEGNFSLAAHRDGHGAKFHNIDKLRPQDDVVVETREAWYVYKVFATLPKTTDDNIGVLKSIPEGSGRYTKGRYITLTTCTPVLTSDFRLIVWGELVRVEEMDAARTPPAELRQPVS